MKSTIAVIGAGENIGEAIARKLAAQGYPMLLMCEAREKLEALAAEIRSNGNSVEVISCARDAAWEADIIVPAVDIAAIDLVAGKIKEVAVGKIVVSTGRTSTGDVDAITAALQEKLPYSRIIKATAKLPGDIMGADAMALDIIQQVLSSRME